MEALPLLIALTYQPIGVTTGTAEVVECNHVMRQDGGCQFTQVILWRWHRLQPHGYHVSEWMMLSGDVVVTDRMQRKRVQWRDNHGRIYDVTCQTFCETFTLGDPEVMDRAELAENRRVRQLEE